MKKIAIAAVFMLTSSLAWAGNKHLCCDLSQGQASAPCIGSATSCVREVGAYVVEVWDADVSGEDASGWNPLSLDGSFPDGVDGYVYWSSTAPFFGYCLAGPASDGDPIGCFAVTLKPGLSGQGVKVRVPWDDRWDGYEFCYGASDKVDGCESINDGLDPTVSETPGSHSCCGPIESFREQDKGEGASWVFGLNQELPGIPPPFLIIEPDAGIVPYYVKDLHDYLVTTADAGCLREYNETPTCGMLGADADMPSPGAPPVIDETPSGGCDVGGGRPGGGMLIWVGLLAYAFTRRRAVPSAM